MAGNILYVTVTGSEVDGEVANPTKPFSLLSAINYVNSIPSTALFFLNLAPGNYNVRCPTEVAFSHNMIITGRDPRSTILNVYQIQVNNSAEVTFQSLGIRSCQTVGLFNLNNGVLYMNNCSVNLSSGTLFLNTSGSVLFNRCVCNIFAQTTLPVVNLTSTAAVLNNSLFQFNFPNAIMGPTALIGLQPRQGSVAINGGGIVIQSNGGTGFIVPYFNVNSVVDASIQARGSGSEGLILYGTNALATATGTNLTEVTPYYVMNLSTKLETITRVYSVYNQNNYPVVVSNLTWEGLPRTPGAYGSPTIGQPVPTLPTPATTSAALVNNGPQAPIQRPPLARPINNSNQMNGGINQMNGGINQMNGGINQMNGGINQMNGGINQMNGGMNQMNGGMGMGGVGTDYTEVLPGYN